jgi:predicted TIM-barrel fold metal-dependent hydrolase
MKIIDMHMHLGDILNAGGEKLINKTGVRKKILIDPISTLEVFQYRRFGVMGFFNRIFQPFVVRAERARNLTATMENYRKAAENEGITYSACMPIPPHVTFSAINDAAKDESRIIPFTGIDFSSDQDIESALRSDVKAGAKGLKLHPIIQNIPFGSRQVLEGVEAFSQHQLPVLFHCGRSSYYTFAERKRQNVRHGDIAESEKLVSAFPSVSFIAGHAGLFQVSEAMRILGKYKNVWVDVSFQSPGIIRKLIKVFGADRILYGSDWPYGGIGAAKSAVKSACRGDLSLEKRIFYENAAELLRI